MKHISDISPPLSELAQRAQPIKVPDAFDMTPAEYVEYLWAISPEAETAFDKWAFRQRAMRFLASQEFRNARLAFKRRIENESL